MHLRVNQLIEIRAETANGIPSIKIVAQIKQISPDAKRVLVRPIEVGGMVNDLPPEYWADASLCRVAIPKPRP